MASQSPNGISSGPIAPQSTWGEFNNISFVVKQAIARMQTSLIVEIIDCTNDGETSPVGTVTVRPVVNQIDGNGNAVPHLSIFNVPYLRFQGGTDAVIIDPKPGDLGIALFASRDISRVVSTKAAANPGSFRQYNFADAMYVGGLLNGTPVQYVRFISSGIEIVSPTKITLRAPLIEIDGAVTISETLSATGDVTSGPDGEQISLQTHVHTSAAAGHPTSEPLP